MTHWKLQDGTPADEMFPFETIIGCGYHGFVYNITNLLTGQMYIGRKRMTRRLTLKPLKGYKRKRKVVKESDWQKYTGTSKALNADIERDGIENFKFEILSIHTSQTEMNYHEMAQHFLRNVLQAKDSDGEKLYYNDNIAQQFYSAKVPEVDAARMALHESFTSQ